MRCFNYFLRAQNRSIRITNQLPQQNWWGKSHAFSQCIKFIYSRKVDEIEEIRSYLIWVIFQGFSLDYMSWNVIYSLRWKIKIISKIYLCVEEFFLIKIRRIVEIGLLLKGHYFTCRIFLCSIMKMSLDWLNELHLKTIWNWKNIFCSSSMVILRLQTELFRLEIFKKLLCLQFIEILELFFVSISIKFSSEILHS